MKVNLKEIKVICSNPNNPNHAYFAWPSVARLHDGRLAMVASGFRKRHICPFGKAVICYSDDEGKSWTRPAVVIDTPLDDRDAGIVPFGEKSVMVTSFNNTKKQQMVWNESTRDPYVAAYLDTVHGEEAEEKFLGSTFVISEDDGKTFGDVMRIPVTAPHGPVPMPDGSILYVGRTFSKDNSIQKDDCVQAYRLMPDGSYEKLGRIENIANNLLSCEPHTVLLPSGKLVVHIRVHNRETFTIYQSESYDGGKTFTKPHALLEKKGGAPAHLRLLENGTLISVYGHREAPYGIRMMYSKDEGETWSTDHVIWADGVSHDLGYPASVQLKNGDILTVFYAKESIDEPCVIMQAIWQFEE